MQRDLGQINKLYNDNEADKWGSDWRGSLAVWHEFCISHILDRLSARFDESAHIKILEIGCGSGVLTEKIFGSLSKRFRNIDYAAVDIYEKAIEKARELFPKSQVKYQTVAEDLSELNGNLFNVIIGIQFIYYLNSSERLQLFDNLGNLACSNALYFFSSNIQAYGDDADYINSLKLENDFRAQYLISGYYDVFISQFAEIIERKTLRYSKFKLIKLLLKGKRAPRLFHNYFSKRATSEFPRKRIRLYLLEKTME